MTDVVTLEPFELEHVTMVGLRRHHANLARADAAHYDRRRMQDNITASVAGAACECGVAKVLNVYWSGSAWDSGMHEQYRHEPDVMPNIEIRRVRSAGNPLAVRRRDVASGRTMVSAYADETTHFATITVNGWLPAQIAWELGSPAPYDPENTHLVEQSMLYPMERLVLL